MLQEGGVRGRGGVVGGERVGGYHILNKNIILGQGDISLSSIHPLVTSLCLSLSSKVDEKTSRVDTCRIFRGFLISILTLISVKEISRSPPLKRHY